MPTPSRVARTASTAVLATTTTLLTLTASLLAAAPAGAATSDPAASSVIAADSTAGPAVRPASARMIGVDADLPAGLTITGAQGKPVTITAKGQKARTAIRRDGAPVVFTKLTPGKKYTVYVGGIRIGTATPVAIPTRAWGLVVSTTGIPGEVSLSWQHAGSLPQGRISYVLTATPRATDGLPLPGGRVVTITVTGTTGKLTGLDPHALYTFTAAPQNSAGHGGPSTAVMNRTLGQIWGSSDVAADPAPAPKPTVPVPAAAVTPPAGPAATPSGPSAPSTRTIYVCPSGYVDAGDACTDTKAYTFHTETVTLTYTFHTGVVGSHVVTHPPTHCDYLPNPNSPTGLDIYCTGGYDETVLDYGNVKDATPTGYTDNGTAWVKDVQIKDTAPTGYADSGTAWVKTVGKLAQVVPA